MCGIFAIFSRSGQPLELKNIHGTVQDLREIGYRQSGKQRHRGPDDTGIKVIPEHGVILVNERLSIIGLEGGNQPLYSEDGNIVLVANGEIYNYLELANRIATRKKGYIPKSDCNVIIEMYEEFGERLLGFITGMFAFVLYDIRDRNILIARDPFGIIPLYIGQDVDGNIWVASEMKCLVENCLELESFAPGELRVGSACNMRRKKYFCEPWMYEIPTNSTNLNVLRRLLECAVRSHLQSDAPFGAILTGDVDSGLIASIATRLRRETDRHFRLKTFSVGLRGSPDLQAAQQVADYINSQHREVVIEVDNALDGLRDVIYHLETYDVNSIRCSLPMLILARYIRTSGIKMILSGEGADDIFGGFVYCFQAPSPHEFQRELVRRLQEINMTDCLRANKIAMAKGLELRAPFLDTQYVNYVMSIRPEDRIPGQFNYFGGSQEYRMEKYILRSAFAQGFLPQQVLWRQKEQTPSKKSCSELTNRLCALAEARISDSMFACAQRRFPDNTPTTKEAFYYRCLFDEFFPGKAAALTVRHWVPRTIWGCSEEEPKADESRPEPARAVTFNCPRS